MKPGEINYRQTCKKLKVSKSCPVIGPGKSDYRLLKFTSWKLEKMTKNCWKIHAFEAWKGWMETGKKQGFWNLEESTRDWLQMTWLYVVANLSFYHIISQ